MLGGKRSDLDITLAILRLVRKEERKTRIMYGANLSYAMLTRYLEFLTRHGFIVRDVTTSTHRLTAKGIALSQDLERVSRHFETVEEEFPTPLTPRKAL